MHPPAIAELDPDLSYCDHDLMAPPWSFSDLIGGAVIFAVAALIAGIFAARWLV